jgi:hypothetical protein
MNIVTRSTYSPSAQERLARWFQRSANLRAAASLGCETSMERAPNVIPLRPRQTTAETLVEAAATYCRPKRYAAASAIQKGKDYVNARKRERSVT